MKNYKWQLRKSSKKDRCPACGRYKCFVPYVSVVDNSTSAGPLYGRCERINSCGYIKYPAGKDNGSEGLILPLKPIVHKQHDVISWGHNYVVGSFGYTKSILWYWAAGLFGLEKASKAFSDYHVGGTQQGSTVFWQVDKDNYIRTGKVMYYNPDGKRNKYRPSWYIHKKISPDFELKQVFFGEHLIGGGSKPIALVESEKTAVIMSILEPNYVWLASGGANMLNTYRLGRLPRLDMVYPDHGCLKMWYEKTRMFDPMIDMSVDDNVYWGKLNPGADILDLYLLTHENKHSNH